MLWFCFHYVPICVRRTLYKVSNEPTQVGGAFLFPLGELEHGTAWLTLAATSPINACFQGEDFKGGSVGSTWKVLEEHPIH